MARCLGGTVGLADDASGIIISLTIGRLRWPRTSSSNTLSSAEESDASGWMMGFRSSIAPPEPSYSRRASWLFIQLTLPRMVLISPLCASTRNGWASFHWGEVLVEERWWEMAKSDVERW